MHKQAIRILLFKIVILSQFVGERDYNSFPASLTGVMILEVTPGCTMAILDFRPTRVASCFFQVSAENNRNIRETFGNSQIDRVISAIATFEVNLCFVSGTDRPTVRMSFSRMRRNRERQTFADQL